MKQNESEKLPSFSLRSKMEVKFFFASMRKNEMKRKQNEKEVTTSKRKRKKLNSGTICKESKKNIKAGLLLFHFYT